MAASRSVRISAAKSVAFWQDAIFEACGRSKECGGRLTNFGENLRMLHDQRNDSLTVCCTTHG